MSQFYQERIPSLWRANNYFDENRKPIENTNIHIGMILLRSENTGQVWTFNGFPDKDPWGPGYRIVTMDEAEAHFRWSLGQHWNVGLQHSNPRIRGIDGDSTGFYRLNNDIDEKTMCHILEDTFAKYNNGKIFGDPDENPEDNNFSCSVFYNE